MKHGAAIQDAARAILNHLRVSEWSGTILTDKGEKFPCCPSCLALKDEHGHAPECSLEKLMLNLSWLGV